MSAATTWFINCPECNHPFALENSDGEIQCVTAGCSYAADDDDEYDVNTGFAHG